METEKETETFLNVPLRFKLFGETIDVVWDNELSNRDNANGMSNYRYSRIELQPNTKAVFRSKEQVEQSYLHEVVHFILEAIQEEKLRTDEKFVELFSKALHQVLTTSEYGTVRELPKELVKDVQR